MSNPVVVSDKKGVVVSTLRITVPLFRILGFFFYRRHSGCDYCGVDVVKELNLAPGIVYPRLERMTESGYLESYSAECANLRGYGRPRKNFYRITPEGESRLLELQDLFGKL